MNQEQDTCQKRAFSGCCVLRRAFRCRQDDAATLADALTPLLQMLPEHPPPPGLLARIEDAIEIEEQSGRRTIKDLRRRRCPRWLPQFVLGLASGALAMMTLVLANDLH